MSATVFDERIFDPDVFDAVPPPPWTAVITLDRWPAGQDASWPVRTTRWPPVDSPRWP